ncbi:hypothetical protein BD779DRAFT_1510329 [Infundibulicybe gibba]|nr:hypothetical protein BD779DRAFT_1510329 [Infundibulicybe gibba]
MPLVSVADRAPAGQFVEVVTTTIFNQPSGSLLPTSGVGGVAAGAVIAIALTMVWIFWGRLIKRDKAKQKQEAESLRRTKSNTRRNAALSKPWSHTYRPLYARPAEKKIKFAAPDEPKQHQPEIVQPHPPIPPPISISSPKKVVMPIKKPRPTPRVYGMDETRTEPKPTELVPAKDAAPKVISEKGSALPRSPLGAPPITPATTVSHRPSTLSSASAYSTASGDGDSRTLSGGVLQALGDPGKPDAVLPRSPQIIKAFSNWPFLRHHGSRESGNVRLSQGSSLIDYPQPEDQPGVPIGYAY